MNVRPWLIAVSLVAKTTATCVAIDSADRIPEALRGMSTVFVTVTDNSTTSGMPPVPAVLRRMEFLLQTECRLAIAPDAPIEIHLELAMSPYRLTEPNGPKVSSVRASVWQWAIPTLADGKTVDASKAPMRMSGWMYNTVTTPTDDPDLEGSLRKIAGVLRSTLDSSTQIVVPRNFSDSFFRTHLNEMESRMERLMNDKLRALPYIDRAATDVRLHLTLDHDVLTYTIRGKVKSVPVESGPIPFDLPIDTTGDLNVALLAPGGNLAGAKICLPIVPGVPPQCVSVTELMP